MILYACLYTNKKFDGPFAVGDNHGTAWQLAFNIICDDDSSPSDLPDFNRGFLASDDDGNLPFMNRKEAYAEAERCNQLFHKKADNLLLSGDFFPINTGEAAILRLHAENMAYDSLKKFSKDLKCKH